MDPYVPSLHSLHPMSFHMPLGVGMKLQERLPPNHALSLLFGASDAFYLLYCGKTPTPEEIDSS